MVRKNPMSDFTDSKCKETLYRVRAEDQTERWRELARSEKAWRFQRRTTQQQMHAGPMQMGPNPVGENLRAKEQG